MKNRSSKLGAFWPNIIDEPSAREAGKQGWVAALFAGGITLFCVLTKTTPLSSLFDVGIICLIGFGCLKMSRVASTLGLVYTIFSGLYKYCVHSTFGLMPLFAIFFINSMRGSFYFHRRNR